MTRTDYQAIAEIIFFNTNQPWKDEQPYIDVVDLITELCDYFEKENPNFNREKFIEACHEGSVKSLREL